MLSEQALNKRNWEGKEDVLLLELHAAYGPNWTRIAGGMGIRSAKQCRERYTQHLKPGLNRSPISDDEGRQIMRMVSESGQRWAQIARSLGTNRSDNQIKNWWNGAKRKETSKRQEAGQEQQQHNHHNHHQQYPKDLSPSLGLAALPERRGILPPVPLDLPFEVIARSRSSPARSYDSERPPSLVSDNGSSWSISQPASASCSPTTYSLPPLLFAAPPTPPTGSCLPAAPSIRNHGFGAGPVRRSSEVLQPSGYSPRSRYVNTAPTTPVGRTSSTSSSSRWEPYPTKARRPSTGYYYQEHGHESESEKREKKGSLSFLLN
jgi:Myb-like DNA-binding protein FlbD